MIQRLLSDLALPVYGFYTRRIPLSDGDCRVYMHAASGEAPPILLAESMNRKMHAYAEAFNSCGVELLEAVKDDGIIVMDELGFLESEADLFCRKVLETLSADIPVLAAVKASHADNPFLIRVRNHPNCLLFTVTPENREQLYEEIKAKI